MYVAVDFGSTNTRVASSRNLEDFVEIEKFKTNNDLETQKSLLMNAINNVSLGEEIGFLGMGIHGLIDKSENKFIKLPNYPALNNVSFTKLFGDKFKSSRMFVENDAAVAALAEANHGAGRGFDVVGYLTISTGIGGARVTNRALENSCTYEPGHQIIIKDGKLNSSSGIKGDFGVYASGRYFKENFGVSSETCDDNSIWEEYSTYLAVGIHNVINLWCPDVLVLGGGIGYNKYEKFYNYLIANLKEMEFVKIPQIKRSELGDDAGLYGALTLIKNSEV